LPAIPCADGSIPRRKSRPTPQGERAPDQLLELADEVRTSDVSHAVVAVPGRVDYRAGRLEYAPNLSKHWTEKLRVDYLEEKLGLDVALANDADAAAVGEAYFGAGRCYDDVAYLTVSTGIGAGVVRRVPRIQLFPFRATGSVLVGPQCQRLCPKEERIRHQGCSPLVASTTVRSKRVQRQPRPCEGVWPASEFPLILAYEHAVGSDTEA
jgi:hypothetical protein